METLPDYLELRLGIVFIGLNPSTISVREGHYFANPRNRFWGALSQSGLLDQVGLAGQSTVTGALGPEQDHTLPQHGIGLTDVVKRPTSQGSGLTAADYRQWAPVLKEKLEHYRPLVACYHGMMAYRNYLWHAEGVRLGEGNLGVQAYTIGDTQVFVTPNPSPANARYSLSDLAGWYRELGTFVTGLKQS